MIHYVSASSRSTFSPKGRNFKNGSLSLKKNTTPTPIATSSTKHSIRNKAILPPLPELDFEAAKCAVLSDDEYADDEEDGTEDSDEDDDTEDDVEGFGILEEYVLALKDEMGSALSSPNGFT